MHRLSLWSVLTLTGCASGVTPMAMPMPKPAAILTLPCPPLPMPASGRALDLLTNHIEVAQHYAQCRAKQRALSEFLMLRF
jgi:hypothetical protein